VHITLAVAEESIQRRTLEYDRAGDEHYDTISAFIKSVRGSDPDAALYYLAKMIAAGEDPRFVLRRLLILAAEDIGLADPWAIMITASCADAFECVGLPEGQYHLAEATLYLATAPKSNSLGAYWEALGEIERNGYKAPPVYLRDKSSTFKGPIQEQYRQMLGDNPGYKLPHNFPRGWVAQRYLPEGVEGGWFHPKGQAYEQRIIERLRMMRGESPKGDPEKNNE
jgi:putative ATPase